MFAPRSTQLPRTYSVYQQPTTSKKNLNKENANGLPSKTPSRAGKSALAGPTTGMRMGLGVKTEGRDRNVLMQQGGMGQGGGKGKGKEGEDIGPKRLFAHGPSKSTTSIPPSKSLSSMPHIQTNISHSQIHKTPARSRKQYQSLRTPAPVPAPALTQEPAPTPLPSATRQRRRSRQSLSNISLTPIKASIAEQNEQNFKTPAPVQWEEELSLGSIEENINEILQNVQEENEVEEDYEPEYMPPSVQELPYTPAYDHPDLVSIFSTLSSLPPMWSHNDDVIIREVPEFQFDTIDIQGLSLQDDEDLEEEWLKPKFSKTAQPVQSRSSLINKSKIAPVRGVPPKTASVTRPAFQPTATSRLSSKPPSSSTRFLTNPINRTKPPAPVPRPPLMRPTLSSRTVVNDKQSRSALPTKTQAKKVLQIDEDDKKLFEIWDKDDAGMGGEVELHLDLSSELASIKEDEGVEMNLGELKISD